MNDSALLDELAQLAARQIGLRIPDDARTRFAAILRGRATGYSSLQDYLAFLLGRQAGEEWEELARVFTSGETFFFRDQGQFDLLRLRLLPELIERHRNDKILRLWSAGCASGEEAYSLAMLVDMLLPERSGWDILILGTDIDSNAIAKARRGCYGSWSFRMVPDEIRQRYFNSEPNTPHSYRLDERIRRMVTFRIANLVSEPFPDPASELHNLDLILCRNVFIYFEPAAVFAVAEKFAASLQEGGYLMTAHTELIGHPVRELESRLFAEGVVYQRRVQELAALPSKTVQGVVYPHPVRPPCGHVESIARRHATSTAGQAGDVKRNGGGGKDVLRLKEARAHAERGEFEQAELLCHQALAIDPLAATPYYLLAQLSQVKGEFGQAMELLNKALYLDHHFVAALLELAALCERSGRMPRARALRHAAYAIVHTMPADAMIAQYETTAGELERWLFQWEHEPDNGHKGKPA